MSVKELFEAKRPRESDGVASVVPVQHRHDERLGLPVTLDLNKPSDEVLAEGMLYVDKANAT